MLSGPEDARPREAAAASHAGVRRACCRSALPSCWRTCTQGRRGYRLRDWKCICSARSSISARKTLRLRPPPGRPEERLDFLTQGNIVHAVLAKWYAVPGDIEPLFEEEFARVLEEKRIPTGLSHRAPAQCHAGRSAGLRGGRPLAAPGSRNPAWKRRSSSTSTEGIRIAGKIDRLDIAPDGTRIRDGLQVQPRADRQGQARRREPVAGAALCHGGGACLRHAAGGDALRGAEGRNRGDRMG